MSSFKVTSADFGSEPHGLAVGIANIKADASDVAANQDRIREALSLFNERGVHIAVFPEFCFTGYFWEDESACRAYMETATLEYQESFIMRTVRPFLNKTLRFIVLNVLRRAGSSPDRFYNSTLVIGRTSAGREITAFYDKAVPSGIENRYQTPGGGRRLVLETEWGRFGFLTCYDLCFPGLLLGYHLVDRVDAVILTAAWRGPATRTYTGLGLKEEYYYGRLWEMLIPAQAAATQAWFFAANAVGCHRISQATFWGGSGVWAPSGLPLLRAGHEGEELLILHHIPLSEECRRERADFDYRSDGCAAGLPDIATIPAQVVDGR